MGRIITHLFGVFVAVVVPAIAPTLTSAHPHVLPTVRLDIVFDADQRPSALRQTWTYDSMYSTFAARDIDSNKDGTISDGELADFAKRQLDALTEHAYFTTVTAKAERLDFGALQSYAISKLGDGRLELTFTAPFKTAPASKQLVIEIFDPNFFAYFTMAPGGVRLIGERDGCGQTVTGPEPIDLKNTRSIPSIFWQALDGSKTAGLQFVNRIVVTCP